MFTTNPEKNLLRLLRVPSPSGQEHKIIKIIEQSLANNFLVKKIPVSKNRHNLFLLKGKPRVVLAAHVDTVIGDLSIKNQKNFITGRGSCDNKGAAAAMIAAALEATEKKLDNFALLFTVGEEVDFCGAIKAAKFFKKQKITPQLIVIGEPTDLKIVTAQYGVLVMKLSCSGTAAHSSLPDPDSAIHKLVLDLNKILEFKFPKTIFHLAQISGGQAPNIIADRAEAVLTFRSADKNLKNKIIKKIRRISKTISIEILKNLPPTNHASDEFPNLWVSYFTEMAFLTKSIVLGPGSIKLAHSKKERVPKKELRAVKNKYLEILSNQLSKKSKK
jgi:acetylornithine deacetylase